jgi:ELWxxDGT repeat protein
MRRLRTTGAVLLALFLLCAVSAGSVLAAEPPHLLKDLRPGDPWNPFAEHFTTVGDRVFFDADDGVHGRELFVSDGTVDGTYMVKDINPGSGDGLRFDSGLIDRNSLTAVGERLFFIARGGAQRPGLYVTDGTDAGTIRIARWRDCDGASRSLVAVGSSVMFARRDATGACNLYVSDGLASGAILVSGPVPSFQMPVLFKGKVFFLARNDDFGTTLWKSATLPGGGARKVRGFAGQTAQLVVSGARLFLNPGTALWSSDGTRAGTRRVARGLPISAHWLTDVDGKLVFQAAASSSFGTSIWRTRGTAASTRMLRDLGPEAAYSNWGGFSTDHHAYFNAGGAGLWASDGTVAGTVKVGQMRALWSTSLGDQLYFAGCDDTCYPVFTSDGTPEGTHRLPGPTNTVQLGAAGDTVYLAENGELWVYVP